MTSYLHGEVRHTVNPVEGFGGKGFRAGLLTILRKGESPLLFAYDMLHRPLLCAISPQRSGTGAAEAAGRAAHRLVVWKRTGRGTGDWFAWECPRPGTGQPRNLAADHSRGACSRSL